MRLAYLLTGERALAEDLVQDAFLRVLGRFHDLRNRDAFWWYLRRTIVNLAHSQFRRRRVERVGRHRSGLVLGRAADREVDLLDRFLVAEAILHRRDATLGERTGRCCDRSRRVHRLGRNDAEVTRRQLLSVGRRPRVPDDIAGTAQPQPVAIDCVNVLLKRVLSLPAQISRASRISFLKLIDR